jgi:hypothetical protein
MLATYNELKMDDLLMIVGRVVVVMSFATLASSTRGTPPGTALIVTPFLFQFSSPAII